MRRIPLPGAVLLIILLAAAPAAAGAAAFRQATCGPASLKLVDGVPLIHVFGTPDQMGEQQGKLLAPQVKLLLREYLAKFVGPRARPAALQISRRMQQHIPRRYLDEMKALAKAAGVAYEDVLLANTVFDIRRGPACSAIVALGGRSADKKPIFGRNLDFPTLGVAHKYTCVIVYHPNKGHAVASVSFPGFIGVLSGLNDAGVTAAVMEVWRRKGRALATPYALVFRDALTGAASTDDVLAAVKKRARTSNNNLMICDAAGSAACAELGLKRVAVRWPSDNVIYSTNDFRSKEHGRAPFCPRIARIEKELRSTAKVDAAAMKRILAAVNQGPLTMQSIVFRPASREFALAAGEPPSTRHRYVLLNRALLFPAAAKKP